ncbi:hypothetical protein [Arthrobacter castelli]|uniref:hypothetical protein n=1 Tax=Arthrobacter castelli TaxID=271431 RepID=UPI00040D69C4|nr:hypothetical protein [Arthrobacter castelli]
MTDSIVVLTEEPLVGADVQNLESFHHGMDRQFFLLVPGDTERHLIVDFLDQLSLLHVGKAFRELAAKQPDTEQRRLQSDATLKVSLDALQTAGLKADGAVSGSNPVQSLVEKVQELDAREAIVITRPHAVEDTFHTDWASKAQDELGLPVLHLYSGSGYIGDS